MDTLLTQNVKRVIKFTSVTEFNKKMKLNSLNTREFKKNTAVNFYYIIQQIFSFWGTIKNDASYVVVDRQKLT
ncbi:hypothetical protein BWI93_25020 [Siphonobacter sp. BAB-5385]|nr:hypothetical protein BWI93_25020 [Siphonobacter sp. BAB-5385]